MFELIEGNLDPDMPLTVSVNGEVVDLTDATDIVLYWRKPSGTFVEVDLTAVDLTAGEVKRVWEAGDSDSVGYHKGRVKVTWDTGETQTFPNDGSWLIWAVYSVDGGMTATSEEEDLTDAHAYLSLTIQEADPEPSDADNYIWLDEDGLLWKTVDGVSEQVGSSASNNVTLTGAFPGVTDVRQLFRATLNATASTAGDCETIRALSTGTYDTTAGALDVNCVLATATVTRSAGANPLTTTALHGQAAGAQVNTALKGIATDGATTNTGLHVTATGGTTNMAIDADNGGDVALCGATDKLGFHGTSPIAKQTGVAVTPEAIHAALVALGLISA